MGTVFFSRMNEPVGGADFFHGRIDEIAIWERNLTIGEVSDLYNDGAGISYDTSTIKISSPVNNYVSNSKNINFVCDATSIVGISNISVWTNNSGTWERSVTNLSVSGASASANLIFRFDSYGNYLWTCEMCEIDSYCAFAIENRTVIVDVTNPKVDVETPNGTVGFGNFINPETLNVTWTDTNLDSCWYEYNNTNTTINCVSGVKNSTTFYLEPDLYNMTFYSNDSGGRSDTTFVEWNYRAFENYQNYTSSVIESSTNEFIINIQTNDEVTVAYLNYNNSLNIGNINSSGNVTTININQIAESVDTTTNISFYWDIRFKEGENVISTTHNQSVSPIIINNSCISGTYVIYNFTLVDEETQKKINVIANSSFIKTELKTYTFDRNILIDTFSHNFNKTYASAICINTNLSGGEQYSMDLQVEYGAVNYSTEFYNIWNGSLKESTLHTNITLYDLLTSDAQEFKILARDSSYLPLDGALIRIERKYIEEGLFKVIEIPRTNEKGITSASLELNDVIYNFYVYLNGVLISSAKNVRAICQTPVISTCSIELNAYQVINFTDYDGDLDFTLGYNFTTRTIDSVFSIPSGVPALVRLQVIMEDAVGTAVCEDSVTSVSGTLDCVVPNNIGNSTTRARLYKNGVIVGWGNINLNKSSKDTYGVILIFISVIMMVTLLGVGVTDNPVVTGIFILIGVVLIYGLNIIQGNGFLGAGATILFLVIAIGLVIIKAGRRT